MKHCWTCDFAHFIEWTHIYCVPGISGFGRLRPACPDLKFEAQSESAHNRYQQASLCIAPASPAVRIIFHRC
jgi:hypothetical protein